tara:strand:+ start:1267 stop:1764 length:498 start_codon:yes stop_codon:yes gene_type:complete
MADTIQEYWQTVKDIAEEIHEQYPDPDSDNGGRNERVHEDVDGSRWIIYYSANQVVLDATNNEPDAGDIIGLVAPDSTWLHMRTIAAFLAMEADICDVLRGLDDAAEEAELEAVVGEACPNCPGFVCEDGKCPNCGRPEMGGDSWEVLCIECQKGNQKSHVYKRG